MAKVYNLFISHSWAYGDAYDKLISMLDNKAFFEYRDYSVPKGDPIHKVGTDKQLADAIQRQMSPCHIVLIMAGVYSTYSKWINKEIKMAKEAFSVSKPILAIRPWAQTKVSTAVSHAADDFAGWNTDSIVSKIRELSL